MPAPIELVDIEPTLAARGNFSQLLAAGRKAGALESLDNPGPFTIFAPTDEAFARLPAELSGPLMNDTEALRRLLYHHAITGKVVLAEAEKRGQEMTPHGSTLHFKRVGNDVLVNGARILESDVMCRNGVVHVVDQVLFPPGLKAELAAPQAASEAVVEPVAPMVEQPPQPAGP